MTKSPYRVTSASHPCPSTETSTRVHTDARPVGWGLGAGCAGGAGGQGTKTRTVAVNKTAMHRVHSVGAHINSSGGGGGGGGGVGGGVGGGRSKMWDLLIAGGRVIDPASSFDAIADVAVSGGRVAAVAPNLPRSQATQVFEAGGLLVTPGLIDTHVHCFPGATTLGVPADEYCLGRGCTTVCDAGSAGPSTLGGFAEFVHDQCAARVLAFCHIAKSGLATGMFVPPKERKARGPGYGRPSGELDHLSHIATVGEAAAAIEQHRRAVCGVKIRLGKSLSNGGEHEAEGYARARELAEEIGMPLMTHHTGEHALLPWSGWSGPLQ